MEGLLYVIQQEKDYLSKNNKVIAQYLIKNVQNIVWMSAEALAKEIGVSQAAVTRFCKQFGFDGFAQLKIALSQEIPVYDEKTFYDNSEDFKNNIAKALLNQNIASFQDTFTMLNQEDILKAAQLLNKSRKIICAGIGVSDFVAQDMVGKLLRIQKDVVHYNDNDCRKIAVSNLTENDLLFVVSYSGRKKEMLELAEIAKKNGVPIIALTRVGETPLSELADISFGAASLEKEYRATATTSRIMHFYIVDILFYTYGLFYNEKTFESLYKTYEVVNKEN
ncbi:MAG: MurR/RpiR family transcriptional regulator [Lacrimispora sp.]|uniref:MurR/RpiR family transcriptional regulator n=1 Tax=Lacrimispora sp. TaxID=2719234 RepID=UPI0039E6A8EC